MSGRSIVEFFGSSASNHCGYCKTTDFDKHSHGMWAHHMTAADYNALLDRGWRRSGKYCYKPTLNKTCCPQYTIRLDAPSFRCSKSQKRVISRVNEYLTKGTIPRQRSAKQTENKSKAATPASSKADLLPLPKKDQQTTDDGSVKKDCDSSHQRKPRPPGGQQKAMRRQRALERMAKKGITAEMAEEQHRNKGPRAKTLEERLNVDCSSGVHKLELRLVRSHPPSPLFNRSFAEVHALYFKYQTVVHKDEPNKPTERQFRRFLCDSPLIIKSIVLSAIGPEIRQSEWQLFQKYQIAVHDESDDECDWQTFSDFLLESPFTADGDDEYGFGSFHQQYLLDGKIIAVGVIDILTHCVSSKYLFYDPDYQFLSLGIYSALREIAFVRELKSKLHTDIRWYYMGFYIHSCPKMKYKGAYAPSYLLCPETYTFVPIERCTSKLDIAKYARFASLDQTHAEDGQLHQDDQQQMIDVNSVGVLFDGKTGTYAQLRLIDKKRTDENEVNDYARVVGSECARRMLLYRE